MGETSVKIFNIVASVLIIMTIGLMSIAVVAAYVQDAYWSWSPGSIHVGEVTEAYGELTHKILFGFWTGEIRLYINDPQLGLERPHVVASKNAGNSQWIYGGDEWRYISGCQGDMGYPGTEVKQWVRSQVRADFPGYYHGVVRPAWIEENPFCGVWPHIPVSGGTLYVYP